MTAIALPLSFRPETFSMWLYTVQRSFASPEGGSEQVIDRLNDRWMLSTSIPQRDQESQIGIEAYINAMRGMTNVSYLWHMQRPQPRGTMRGSPTAGAAAAGAGSLPITTTAGATMRAGDMLGVGGLLLQAAQDATANGSGVMVLPLANRLRVAVPGGSAVTWDRPTAPFRLASRPFVQFAPGFAHSVDLDFVEAIG